MSDALDELYGVPPEQFLARRKELVAAAKQCGDADAAKVIGAARRPTAAAWVVNVLVRRVPTARRRLSELTEALRVAHSTMDGARIRDLTAVQRTLIDELARAAFAAANYGDVTPALRNDVTDTLQAAIADSDVAARLGRLEKAERWSGFGDFGEAVAVGAAKQKPAPQQKPARDQKQGREQKPPSQPTAGDSDEVALQAVAAAQERKSAAASEAEAAKAAHADAVDVVAEQKAKLATARRHYEKLLESLDAAEQAVNAADERLEAAGQAERQAADRLDATTSEVALAESDLAALLEQAGP